MTKKTSIIAEAQTKLAEQRAAALVNKAGHILDRFNTAKDTIASLRADLADKEKKLTDFVNEFTTKTEAGQFKSSAAMDAYLDSNRDAFRMLMTGYSKSTFVS